MPDRVHVLLVEDRTAHADKIEETCLQALPAAQVLVEPAEHLASALDLLERHHFDLAICDLSIPRDQASMAPDRDHGLALVRVICEQHSGLPLIILSEMGKDPEVLRELMRQTTRADPYGLGSETSMLSCHAKEELPECQSEIRVALERSAGVASVLITGTGAGDLDVSEARALQVFARRRAGATLEVEGLAGGLSGAKTLRVKILDEHANPIGHVAAKLGPLARVREEDIAWNRASMMLPQGIGVPLIGTVEVGAGRYGGAFYRLAEHHTRDLVECLENDAHGAVAIVEALEGAFGPLYAAGKNADSPVLKLRRDIVRETDASRAGALESRIRALDSKTVEVLWCLQHGDLHGKNVLVDGEGHPLLIDYADVRKTSGCLDPVTLELSTVFHPACQSARGSWPTVAQAAQWQDLDAFVLGCPFEEYIRTCRSWSTRVMASPGERDAVVLSYSLRQLGYPKCPREVALAVIEQACHRLET